MGYIDDIFKKYKENWATIAQISAWLLGILGVFLIPPPVKNYMDQNTVTQITAFAVAAIVALLIIPIRKYSKKLNYKGWYWISVITFFLFSILFSQYFQYDSNWTVDYYGVKLIHGDRLLPEALKAKKYVEAREGRPISNIEFIKYMPDLNETIWEPDLLSRRLVIIRILYLVCFLLASFFIITIMQAISCYHDGEISKI